MSTRQKFIRNFAIVAHIDHGKSTLADRIMEMTSTISEREAEDQLLDDLSVEKAHGVTVKSRTVRNYFIDDHGDEYQYNLIDTPGHVDFNYEVSRSLSATDGVLLLVDATKGVQAQTVANYRLAKEANLVIIPIVNKIDTAAAEVEATINQLGDLDDAFTPENIIKISAKSGLNVEAVLTTIRDRIPAPAGDENSALQALVFDSKFDPYKGIIVQARLVQGMLNNNDQVLFMANEIKSGIKEMGVFAPLMTPVKQLRAGDVGFIVTGIKDPEAVKVGDTITLAKQPVAAALPGYQDVEPMVYAGLYPRGSEFKDLKVGIEKLALNDAAFQYEPEQSEALGMGFRGGFLGIFHLQIIRERLKEEFGLDVLTTMPNSTYRVTVKNEDEPIYVENPTQFPDYGQIVLVEEPYMLAKMTMPNEMLNDVMRLAEGRRGELVDLETIGAMLLVTYRMPISEIAYDFFNELKSVSHGFATLSTTFDQYQPSDLVRIDVAIDYAKIDALTFVVHRLKANRMGIELVDKLKDLIPRKLQAMPVQAIVEGRAIARADVPPLRKAQASGTKVSKKQQQMRRQGVKKSDIELPQSVFDAVLQMNSN
ncbi:Translation elongation factor LepA [Weissella jogaejeotgali]|uniref:Elongation factor 4 n=1 Tax=Weissella jogaejeotgali TaxID=1631871 RepID=A0A1L6RB38_9LACO|nr:translation elongation factor 4 [Weissella jogaejeotgali]APS41698.1 Translation elongation factor LepA [Weissella jogaejeotgali]